MKKTSFFKNLPFKLLVAVFLGILAGLILNQHSTNGISMAVLNIAVTIKYILGQIITFCVPLIILGFIAPSITRLGKNASVMLGVAVILAYASSVGAALFSTAAGFFIIPHLSIHSYAAGLKQLPDVIFELEIPQIMSVMSALVFSIMLGLAATWTKAKLITGILEEFQKIVLALVARIIIPVLPLFIGSTFCGLAYEGTITRQLPVFLEVIALVLDGISLHSGRNLLQRKSSGSAPPLRTGLSHRCRNHVISGHPCRSTAVCLKSKATSKRSGKLRNPVVCQYPSLWLCTYGSFLLYGSLKDPVRIRSYYGKYGAVLSASRYFCHWCTWDTWRNGYGLPRHHHRGAEIRQLRHCADADHLCTAGQLRNCLQRYRRWCSDPDADRLRQTASYRGAEDRYRIVKPRIIIRENECEYFLRADHFTCLCKLLRDGVHICDRSYGWFFQLIEVHAGSTV